MCPVCDHTMIFTNSVPREPATCLVPRCVMQSEETELLAPTVPEMAKEEQTTTDFLDANKGVEAGYSTSPLDYELADAKTTADLATFLSRPVLVNSRTWLQSDSVGSTLSTLVWNAYLSNAAIKKKLDNYAFLRGNLKLKFIVNGSPFMYGAMRAVYLPMQNFKFLHLAGTNAERLVPYSQMPGAWIDPAHSEGAELTLPFIWPKSFINIALDDDARNLGILYYTIFSNLRSANGSTAPVTVQTYAWMEDVVLAGPTVVDSMQADEYGVGVVLAPASAVAAAAHAVSNVPGISKFAKATEIGAKATSKIAKLFGFTNVPVIEDTKPIRNSPFPQLASAEIGYTAEKLALDPKNELSIDPGIIGLNDRDELAVANFATRESYLTQVNWSTSTPLNTSLFTSAVQPQLGISAGTTLQFTPMGLLSSIFKNWRGDLIFRFKFIATPFHKGRVRISYDPYSASVQNTNDTGPYVFNKIVDLGAETDIEIRVPYQQPLPWCFTSAVPDSSLWSVSTTPAVSRVDTQDNGIISVKVLTTLSAPTTTSDVTMLVFVRAAENIQYSNPSTGNLDLTPFSLQSEEYSTKGPTQAMSMSEPTDDESTHRALINFGEAVYSLRSVLRRTNLLDTIVVPTVTANSIGVFRINQSRMPLSYGYDTNGWNRAKGTLVPATDFNFNFVNTTPWHLISNCFLAQRGSFNWTFNPSRGTSGIISRVSRYTGIFPGYEAEYYVGTATSNNIATCNLWKNQINTNAGSSLTHTNTTNGHTIVAPSYTPFKFQTTYPGAATDPGAPSETTYDGSVYDSLVIEYPVDSSRDNVSGMTIERYFGVGADYTLHFFLACPTMHYLSPATITPST